MKLVRPLLRRVERHNFEFVLVLLGVAGTIFIFFTSLEFKDKLSAFLLWVAAVLVLYYAIETRRLRIETQKMGSMSSKQFRLQEEIMMNEFMPILSANVGMMQGSHLELQIWNYGRGVAKDIKIDFGEKVFTPGFALRGNDSTNRSWNDVHQVAEVTKGSKLGQRKPVKITYKDVYGREFITSGAFFVCDEPNPKNRFQLNGETWEFKKVGGVK